MDSVGIRQICSYSCGVKRLVDGEPSWACDQERVRNINGDKPSDLQMNPGGASGACAQERVRNINGGMPSNSYYTDAILILYLNAGGTSGARGQERTWNTDGSKPSDTY